MGVERGHPTLVITRKGGGKVVTIPLAPRTVRAIDLAIGERCEGPIFLTPDGRRLNRHGAGRIVRRYRQNSRNWARFCSARSAATGCPRHRRSHAPHPQCERSLAGPRRCS
jgi:integrase